MAKAHPAAFLALACLVLGPVNAGVLNIFADLTDFGKLFEAAGEEVVEAAERISRPLLDMLPASPPHEDVGGAGGEPLFITPLLDLDQNEGRIARKKARVPTIEDVDSYSGYLTVNKEYNSNLFFWFFPATHMDWKSAPLVVWMNGGPGSTSMYGLFIEHGPFKVDAAGNISRRKTTWAATNNMLYIDQPVGTGFSFTDSVEGRITDQDGVARDLFEFMKQFYMLFPEMLKTDLYVAGESYAGKYVPALAHKIHEENVAGSLPQMPLKGLAIGDGMCDPVNQLDLGDFLYQTGLVDEESLSTLEKLANVTRGQIENEEWTMATTSFNRAIDFFVQKTGLQFYYNYLISQQPDDFEYFHKWILKPESRAAIHAGNRTFDGASIQVYEDLYDDVSKSVRPWIEQLLDEKYKVLIYSGQMDVIIPYPTTENFIYKLQWYGAKEYKKAKRVIWKVGDEVAGYAREVGNFRQVMVRNAGHILPYDKPKLAFDLIQRFISGKSFDSHPSPQAE